MIYCLLHGFYLPPCSIPLLDNCHYDTTSKRLWWPHHRVDMAKAIPPVKGWLGFLSFFELVKLPCRRYWTTEGTRETDYTSDQRLVTYTKRCTSDQHCRKPSHTSASLLHYGPSVIKSTWAPRLWVGLGTKLNSSYFSSAYDFPIEE